MIDKFGVDEFYVQMSKLQEFHQTGTVAEYRLVFDTSMCHLLSLDATLSTNTK
jgi:hypothetical protein